jgi:hypothetical protein
VTEPLRAFYNGLDRTLTLKLRGTSFKDFMKQSYPHTVEVMDMLPARGMKTPDVSLKYVIVAVGGVAETLEQIPWTFAGRTPLQIFDQEIAPKL